MKSILIMDDDLSLSLSLAEDLRSHGYDVDTVSTATDAIEIIRLKTYCAVVTDMIVKSEDRPIPDGGLSLIHWLRSLRREDPEKANTPIIGMSGVTKYPGMQTILQTAETLGADVTLEKPVSSEALIATIERFT